jgi:hypothetical protein
MKRPSTYLEPAACSFSCIDQTLSKQGRLAIPKNASQR